VINMSGNFISVACRDCSTETTIFDRSVNVISCGVCGATLTRPAGGKASLVGCRIVDTHE
jgi:small subunit ribosomal protein S27e